MPSSSATRVLLTIGAAVLTLAAPAVGEPCGSALLIEAGAPAVFDGVAMAPNRVVRLWEAGNGGDHHDPGACTSGCESASGAACAGGGDCVALTGLDWLNGATCSVAGHRPARSVVVIEAPTNGAGGRWAAINLDRDPSGANTDLDAKAQAVCSGCASVASPYLGGTGRPQVTSSSVAGDTLSATLTWSAPAAAAQALSNGSDLVTSYGVYYSRGANGVPPPGGGHLSGWTLVADTDGGQVGGYSTDTTATVSVPLGGSTEAVYFAIGPQLDGSGDPAADPDVFPSAYLSARSAPEPGCASPPASPTASSNGPICSGDTLALQASSVGGATYRWVGPLELTSTAQNPTIAGATSAASGLYDVVAVVGGCTSPPSTVAVDVSAGLDTPVVTAEGCAPPSTSGLTASAEDHAGSGYAWTLTGGSIDSGQGSSAITFTAGSAGTRMTVAVVESAGAGCPSDPGEVIVQVDFGDVPEASPLHDFVCALGRAKVTAGCGSGNYCPNTAVTREQMAVFLLVSLESADYRPPPATGVFTDVPVSSPFARWIEELARRGITGGCGTNPPKYCPDDPVTREQMAVFLLATAEAEGYLPPDPVGYFEDVVIGSPFARWIEELATRNVTAGCSTTPPRYCPSQAVTRGQMAVFLSVVFGLDS